MKKLAIIIVLLILIVGLFFWNRSSETFTPNVFKDYYYFDANATTPMSTEAAKRLNESLWLGNASTDYAVHTGASSVIQLASDTVKHILKAPDDAVVIFNSGCSEGNSYVFRTIAESAHLPRKHVIVSAFEHKSTIMAIETLVKARRLEVTWITPNSDGLIDPVSVAEAVQENTVLISIMHVNNELGTIQPIYEIGKIARHYDILFHSDIAQSFCKVEVDMERAGLDIVTSSLHKVYGPMSTGILVMTKRVAQLGVGQIHGTQFSGLRGGTENLSAIAAAEAAIVSTIADRPLKNQNLLQHKMRVLEALNRVFTPSSFDEFAGRGDDYIPSGRTKIGFAVLGKNTLPSTLLISFFKFNTPINHRFCNIKLKKALFERKIIVSIGSACNTHSSGPSHVLMALRAPFVIRSGVVRISFTDHTTPEQIDYLIKNLIECVYLQLTL
jgi:cysteine desulfurase